LAQAVEVTPAAIYNWEQNDVTPRHLTLIRVAEVLHVTVESLTDGSTDEPETKKLSIDQCTQTLKREVSSVLGVPVEKIRVKIEIDS